MDSGLSSGAADAAGARGLPARPGMPPEAPASMPSQALGTFDAAQRRVPRSPGGLPSAPWRRLIVLIGAALLAGIATNEMRLVLAVGDLTGLEIAVLVLFALNIAWISAGAAMALAGFLRLAGRTVAKPLPSTAPLGGRTAVLVPMHNEDPARVGAALDAMGRSLAAQGAGASFDLVLLSDTTDGDLALAEHEVVQTLRSRLGESPAVHYRRRLRNTASKPGNIREFCERWGQAYDHLLMLDADSLMDGATMVELARRMEADPDVGLIQTVPRLHLGATLLGRLQQFAATVYGPTQSAGLAWWARSEGTYWGHNAILRTRSFLASAGLPTLSGKPPFGGPLLSHDFVEAALLRRAGWSVVIADDLEGSYEEGPASLLDLAARDRRWCQGNLQHVRLLTARGLHGVSRLHLVNGILAYLSSPLWLLFLLAALALGVQYQFARPDYFPDGPSLFPLWPRLDPVRAVRLFGLTLSILLVPKVLGLAWYASDEARLRASGGPWLLVSFALEVLLSALLAPIMMLFHCASIASVLIGRDSGWKAQGRDGGGTSPGQATRRHAWHVAAGLGLSVVAYRVSPGLLAWMTPAVVPLVLAIPLSTLTSSPSVGGAFRRLGLLGTPDEAHPPAIREAVAAASAIYRDAVARTPDLAAIVRDGSLLLRHLALTDRLPVRREGEVDPLDATSARKIREARSPEEALSFLTPQERARVQSVPGLLLQLAALPGTPNAGSSG